MKYAVTATIRVASLFGLICLTATGAIAQTSSARMTRAANAFLETLDAGQRKSVVFAVDDEQQRKRWSNLPVRMVPRAGLNLGALNATQRTAAMALVSAALSAKGLQKVNEIMEGDEVLKTGAASRGNPNMFGKEYYYISILGTPSESARWILQFGGHHLALNITVAGDRGTLTPSLTAAQPGLYTLNGKSVRPLAGESDKAAILFNSLDTQQRSQAVLGSRVADLVLGPGEDDRTIQPEGLKASAMTERQRAQLLDVITEWAGIIHDDAAAARMVEVRAGLADTWFAWSGPASATPGTNIASYYRVQGPSLVIEYAPQGSDPTMHIHAMYRDPTNDYGRKYTAK
jgi:hypothetical protein